MALLAQASRLGLTRLCCGSARGLDQSGTWRLFSAGPAAPQSDAGNEDIVLSTFRQQQKAYRDLLEGMKNIPVPLNGDESAIRKYADDVEALKKKVGMPEVNDLVGATLNYKLKVAQGNVRKFLASATEGVQLGQYSDVVDKILAAVDEIEKKTGAPLDEANKEGWKALTTKVESIQKAHGLDNIQKVKQESVLEMYKSQLGKIKEDAQEVMEAAKRREGLEFVDVDVASLKPKL